MARLWAVFVLLLFSAAPAYAYLDPGTGSLVMQAVIAAVAATVGGISFGWRWIKANVLRLVGKEQASNSAIDRVGRQDRSSN